MARKKIIPDDIRQQVATRVAAYNEANVPVFEPPALQRLLRRLHILPPLDESIRIGTYVPRFKGAFLYLDRIGFDGQPEQICRLKWTGDMEDWEFAIYLHSRNAYDPDDWFFPGSEEVDGTIEGAMRAGMEAYPL